MSMNLSSDKHTNNLELIYQLDRYLPEKIRKQIEQNYYAKVNAQAELDQVARNEEFLENPLNHVALFSDHGVVHARDVATNILSVLEAINGVLIPTRKNRHLDFMKGYGVMLAYNHDIGMLDFSMFGRAMHPEFAAQEVFTPAFDEIVEIIWAENWGNLSWRLSNLEDAGALEQDPRLVLREMLAMSVGHSKSKIPIDILNEPEELRKVMMVTVITNLHHLYHNQQVNKAAKKLTLALEGKEKQVGQNETLGSLKQPTIIRTLGTKAEDLSQSLHEAKANRKKFLESDDIPLRTFKGVSRYYTDFEQEAFRWIVSGHPQAQRMVGDVTDTIRALRVADALRQRGTVLKTSAGYQILVDQNTGEAIFALQKGTGEMFLLSSDNPLSAGEANIGSSELTWTGDLRLSFHRGAYPDQETIRRSAHNAAVVVDDIQRDIVDTFRRPPGVNGDLKSNQDIQILVEETDDNLDFADLIVEELQVINPELGDKSRVAPSLKHISPDERDRYLAAEDLDWPLDHREKVLIRVAQSGHKIRNIKVEGAFTDVRLTILKENATLLRAGAPPGFVYVPMGEGLLYTPLGGYQAYSIKPWIPLGNTRVIRGDVQEATVTAQQEVKLLMIPKETYLKYWHDTYQIEEFTQLLPRVYVENEMEGLDQMLDILRQTAMIDQVLADTEVEFIQKLTSSYGLDYSVEEVRERMLQGGPTTFISLRQSVIDYLILKPSYLQAARLRDLLNLLVKVDEDVSEEETLILAELNGLFTGYLDEDADLSPYKVWLVPQNQEQDQSIAELMPNLQKEATSGGFAYLVGAYYSKDYADMICDKYRELRFFTTMDREEIGDNK